MNGIDLYAINALSNDELNKEIAFAEAFGDSIDPLSKTWRLALLREKEIRS